MSPILQEALGSIVRHGLGFAAAFMVSSGIWTSGDAEKYVGAAALGLLTIGWSIWQKQKGRIKLLTALGTVGPMSEATLEEKLNTGNSAPSTSTAKDVIPQP